MTVDRTMPSGPPTSAIHFTPAHQVLQRELDPQREHEQDHADLGEQLERVDVGDRRPVRHRADQEAAEDVAEDQRLARQPRERAAEDRRQEDVREVPEEDGIGVHDALTAR